MSKLTIKILVIFIWMVVASIIHSVLEFDKIDYLIICVMNTVTILLVDWVLAPRVNKNYFGRRRA